MTDDIPDFRSFVIDLGHELRQKEVSDLAYYFQVTCKSDDGVALLDKLECEGKISESDMTQLIHPLETIKNKGLAQRVKEYQRKADSEPVIRDSSVFAGRSDELEEIDFHIKSEEESNSLFRALFISGMPGVGKTFLAQEFMRRFSVDFKPRSHFISCRGVKSVVELTDLLKEELELQFSSHRPNFKAIERKLKYCTQTQLVVLDNVEDVMEHKKEEFIAFLNNFITHAKNVKTRRHCLLITSRRQLPEDLMKKLKPELLCVKLDEMTMNDSKSLLTKYLGGRHLEREELEKLATLCGRHPLSMALVANRLRLTPAIKVEDIASTMKRQPLSTLRHMEELKYLATCSCIEGTFEQIFDCLKQSEQELLIALATAPHDMGESIALAVSGRSNNRDEFDLALFRLLDFNLVSRSVETNKRKKSQRYSMHLLTRNFVLQYCQLDDCPPDLRKSFDNSKSRLLDEYVKNMKALSIDEFVNPERFAKTIKKERLNYLPIMGDIYDLLIKEKCSYGEFSEVGDIIFKVMYNTQEHANFLQQRLKFARKIPGSVHIQKYIELRLADMTRHCGKLDGAKELFDKLQRELDREDGIEEEHKRQLQTYYLRYFGRCLKDDTSGNVVRTLNRSIDHLKRAIEGFTDASIFADQKRQKRELAETYYDLGNTLVLLSNQSDTDKISNLKDAQRNFEKTKSIFLEYDKNTSKLFDVHLSLASCDMELLSWHLSSDGSEDDTTLRPALDHYIKAEEIGKANGAVITEDPVRMGNLYYGRAVCHYRAKKYEAAAPDALKALKMRKQVFGTHNKTMICYILLGNIYSCCFGIKRRQPRTLKCYEQALAMANRLSSRKKDVNKSDLERLEFHLMIMCERMKKDYKEYEKVLEAVRSGKPVGNDSAPFAELSSSSESDESDGSDDHPTAMELKKAFDDNESDPDEEESSAPSCSKARELSKKLKNLMDRQAERITRCYDKLAIADMQILVGILVSGYPNMDDEKRIVRYEKGIKLFNDLSKLEEKPAVFLKQHEMEGPGNAFVAELRVNSPQVSTDVTQLNALSFLLARLRASNVLSMRAGGAIVVIVVFVALILKLLLV